MTILWFLLPSESGPYPSGPKVQVQIVRLTNAILSLLVKCLPSLNPIPSFVKWCSLHRNGRMQKGAKSMVPGTEEKRRKKSSLISQPYVYFIAPLKFLLLQKILFLHFGRDLTHCWIWKANFSTSFMATITFLLFIQVRLVHVSPSYFSRKSSFVENSYSNS